MHELESIDLIELGGVLRRVGSLALEASMGLRDAQFSRLGSALQIAGIELQSLEQPNFTLLKPRTILESLIKLCEWGSKRKTSTDQGYRELSRSLLLNDKHDVVFVRASTKVRDCLMGCAVDAKSYRQLKRPEKHFLEVFAAQLEDLAQLETTPRPRRRLVDPEDYPLLNDKIHNLLKIKSRCTCRQLQTPSKIDKGHLSRLCLWPEIQKCDEHVEFDMVFSAQFTLQAPMDIERWQRIRLLAPRSSGTKRATFAIEHKGKHDSSPLAVNRERWIRVRVINSLCEIMQEDVEPAYCRLEVEEQDIYLLREPDPADSFLDARTSISLATVLRQRCLTGQMKVTLAWILVHSVWRFYSSNWMNSGWSTDSIHFMGEDGCPPFSRINIGRPCLVVTFDDIDANSNSEYYGANASVVHHYPRVLSLGILLVEIGSKEAIPNRKVEIPRNRTKQINTDYTTARKALKNNDWPYLDSLRHGRAMYREITSACLDRNLFEVSAAKIQTADSAKLQDPIPTQDAEDRRKIIYEQIVRPIEDLARVLGWQDELQKMKPVDITSSDDKNELEQCEQSTEVLLLPKASFQAKENPLQNSSHLNEVSWLDKLKSSYQSVSTSSPRCNPLKSSGKIKIAVLDTGYDTGSDFFDHDRLKQLRGRSWYDFVERKTDPVDQDGHGTHVLSVLMQAAPFAKIHVARVALDSNDLDKSEENIVKAIKQAADKDEWGVDIILMAFGFPENSYPKKTAIIRKAIDQAISDSEGKLLIFAAAGNEGANERIMFPANHPAVIPIFGTNAFGEFQKSMNPPLTRDDPSMVGTLAVNVPCAGLGDAGEVLRSGTSFAAPIAAGAAATILEDARVLENSDESRPKGTADALKHKGAMVSMFRAMGGARETDQRRYYLNPCDHFSSVENDRWSTMSFALKHK